MSDQQIPDEERETHADPDTIINPGTPGKPGPDDPDGISPTPAPPSVDPSVRPNTPR